MDLFFKAILALLNSFSNTGHGLCTNRYVSYLHDDKTTLRCLLLLIPIIGNIAAMSGIIIKTLRLVKNKTFNEALDVLEPYTISPPTPSRGSLDREEYISFLDKQNQFFQSKTNVNQRFTFDDADEMVTLKRRSEKDGVEPNDDPTIKELQQRNLAAESALFAWIAQDMVKATRKILQELTDKIQNSTSDEMCRHWFNLCSRASRNLGIFDLTTPIRKFDIVKHYDLCEVADIDDTVTKMKERGVTVSEETLQNFHTIANLAEEINRTRFESYTRYLNGLDKPLLLLEAGELDEELTWSRALAASQNHLAFIHSVQPLPPSCYDVELLAIQAELERRIQNQLEKARL